MGYLFDANIFIRSKNELPADVWPTFWCRISELIRSGKIFSSVKVKEEIDRGKDDLTEWMKTNAKKGFYYPVDEEVLSAYSSVQNWANEKHYFTEAAIQSFATVADAYLVATALAKDLTLVTYETSEPFRKNKVKIPDACKALGVRYCDLNTALRELGITI